MKTMLLDTNILKGRTVEGATFVNPFARDFRLVDWL